MWLFTSWAALSQVAVLAAAASFHVVKDPYLATQWNACRSPCDSAASTGWDYYHGLKILKSCEEPMLLSLAVSNPIANSDMRPDLYACSLPRGKSFTSGGSSVPKSTKYSAKVVEVEIASSGTQAKGYAPHVEDAARLVQAQFDQPEGQNGTIAFGYSNGVVLGAYIGSEMDKSKGNNILGTFIDKLRHGELTTSGSMMQVCNNQSADHILGIVSEASTSPTEALAAVQDVLSTWNRGDCVKGYDNTRKMSASVGEAIVPSNRHSSHARAHVKRPSTRAEAGAECRTIKTNRGEGCPELAKRCGISPADFTKYNSDKNLCSSLQAGQHVCCSSGSLPDFSPKPNADGTCATHTVEAHDECKVLAASNGITVDDINHWNAKTWGWQGCDNLVINGKICMSEGDPPMPAVVKNAVCGPQKAGTKRPDNWDDISSLNPCPLNACCDIWGQCGVTLEFCSVSNSTTGAPGTAKNGTNGCISNCGVHVPLNSDAPIEPAVMTYYEAFNNQRPCLTLAPQAIEYERKYGGGAPNELQLDVVWSYIHFAFANITEGFKVDVSTVKHEFEEFKKLLPPPAYKGGPSMKVLSFGGWSFSTDLDSYAIFRKGVTDAQRSLFATNVVDFANENNLDGLDFDWEYPGAPDIPGIPAGDPGDGKRYLQFLREVRDKLPEKKSLSVAVPASYWYLKGFPIKEISDVVTYIVFMTYDLHGQWDWNNPNAADGCDGGGCLRSHVNNTETTIALSMITKAGVPNNKIFAGVASYGRSFKMEDPSCDGPECKFTGPESGAKPGDCTQTAGYIAEAEIKDWLENSGDNITTYFDEDSRSYISFSQEGNWVAYLDQEERNQRLWSWWYDGHFAGTVLWAVDLTEFVSQNPDGTRIDPPKAINCTRSFDNLDDLESATGIDDYCMNIYLMQALSGNLTATLGAYQDELDNNYDEKFSWYEEAIRKSAPLSLSHFSRANASNYFDCIIDQDGTNHTDLGCFSTTGAYGSVYWIARDKPRFEKDLFTVTGISADWLTYEPYREEEHSPSTGSYWHVGYSGVPHLKDDFKINNPKDVVSKRLSSITDFHTNFDFTAFLANETMYMGDMSDAVDGASLAVLMISASVTSMSQVADAGQDYEDEKIKNIILLFLTGVLFLIPGLEEGAAALELAEIANILRLVGTAGDVAMGAYDVVHAKDNAPAAVFGALLGGLGALNMVKAPESFGIAAKARRGMPSAQVEALGPEVKGGLAQIDKLVKVCF